MDKTNTKPFIIPKGLVMEAYELVKTNRGAAGIDQESLGDFDKNLQDNLYKICNSAYGGDRERSWRRSVNDFRYPPPRIFTASAEV